MDQTDLSKNPTRIVKIQMVKEKVEDSGAKKISFPGGAIEAIRELMGESDREMFPPLNLSSTHRIERYCPHGCG